MKISKFAAYIFLSGASACLRTQLRLCPVKVKQGSTRVEMFKRRVQKWKCVPGSCILRVLLLYDPALHAKWYIIISKSCVVHVRMTDICTLGAACAVCESTSEGDDTDLCVLAVTEFCWVDLHADTARPCPLKSNTHLRVILKYRVKRG